MVEVIGIGIFAALVWLMASGMSATENKEHRLEHPQPKRAAPSTKRAA
jgi:hypothetical protein